MKCCTTSLRREPSRASPRRETATFVLSLKQPIFTAIRSEFAKDPDTQYQEIWAATTLLDKLALLTTEGYIATKEQMIARQQEELLELSTPVVKLWDGILALPMIGTLDSARTQVVMESLLQAIVETNSKVAIIDITGVPTVDTLVAQHLIKTITAARLMGADCIISGVRPQIAQTIVHLGINLTDVITKAKLSDAFALALGKSGRAVVKSFRSCRAHARKGGLMERIPILRMGNYLLVTIQVDMHDRLAMTLQDDLTQQISKTGRCRGVDRHFITGNCRFVSSDERWPTSRPWRGFWTRKPWWWACSPRLPSRWWSWGCRFPASGQPLTWNRGWNSCKPARGSFHRGMQDDSSGV